MDLSQLSDEELAMLETEVFEPQINQEAAQTPAQPSNLVANLSDDELLELEASLAGDMQAKQVEGLKTIEKKQYSEFGAGAMGFTQGITLGAADELGGALETAGDLLFGEANFSELSEQYKKNRDALRQEFSQAEEEWSGAYTTGDLAGAVGSAFIPGLNIAKGVKGAATLGAVSGLMRSESESVYGDVTNAIIGGAAGAVFMKGGQAAGRALGVTGRAAKNLGDKIKGSAQGSALVKAMGLGDDLSSTNVNAVLKAKGLPNFQTIQAVADEVGLTNTQIISNPQKAKDLIGSHLRGYGDEMGNIITNADLSSGPSVNPNLLLSRLRKDPKIAQRLNSKFAPEKRATEKILDNLVTPEDQASLWTPGELWRFKRRIPKVATGSLTNLDDKTAQTIANDIDNVLKGALDDVIESSSSAGKVDAKLFRDFSNRYHTLKKMDKLIAENVEFQQSGPFGGVKKAMFNVGAVAQTTNIGAGIMFGPVGYLSSVVLTNAAKSPRIQASFGEALGKAGGLALKNQSYAETVIRAAGLSQGAFNSVVAAGEAMVDFSSNKLERSSTAVKKDFAKVISLLDYESPELAEKLRDAVQTGDDDLIAGIMAEVASTSQSSKYIKPGIGWDGRAITPADIAEVEQQIKGSSLSSIKKMQTLRQFKADRAIPQLEEEKPFYKVYDPQLKTRVMK